MKKCNISFLREGIESTNCRVHSHTFVHMRHDWSVIKYKIFNLGKGYNGVFLSKETIERIAFHYSRGQNLHDQVPLKVSYTKYNNSTSISYWLETSFMCKVVDFVNVPLFLIYICKWFFLNKKKYYKRDHFYVAASCFIPHTRAGRGNQNQRELNYWVSD